MPTISITEARQTLAAQLDRVEAGEEVAITRHGRVVAVIVPPEHTRSRRATAALERAESLQERLDRARKEPLRAASISPERAEELVEFIRAGRSSR